VARGAACGFALVNGDLAAVIALAQASGADVAVIEVQLLFEVGVHNDTDAVVVVSAPEHQQRDRVLSRPRMTAERLAQILARQMPDADKRAKADFVVDTGGPIEATREQVKAILDQVRSPQFRARSEA
jgi:dephospho-CoA kinase